MGETDRALSGSPVGTGIAFGRACFLDRDTTSIDESRSSGDDVVNELEAYRAALRHCQSELASLRCKLDAEGAKEGASIITAQLELLSDPLLTDEVEQEIGRSSKRAAYVFQSMVNEYELRFAEIPDAFFRERVADLQDLKSRILAQLAGATRPSLNALPEASIVIAESISPSEAAEADSGRVRGFVTSSGGVASHTAIVAKAKGIPYVSDIDFSGLPRDQIREVIVDGRTGQVIFNPSPETVQYYMGLQNQLHAHLSALEAAGGLPAETHCGVSIGLAGNVEDPGEIPLLHQYGATGIGLYRSEYLMLTQKKMPSEDEQYAIYRDLVLRMDGRPVVIRTFDIGVDKQLEGKGNALGCRAIRLFLREPETFKTQLRAILRAACDGPAQVLFPMISGMTELRACKALVAESAQELRARGIKVPESVPIGCMIEVPSAALICDLIAKECDFLSIGTNDLVQYILAVDRESPTGHQLYRPTAPGIIRTIKMIVSEGRRLGRPVTICGEVAADPHFTALLIGLGVRQFSVAARHLPMIKHMLRKTTLDGAEDLAARVLSLSTAHEIQEELVATHRALTGHSSSAV